MPAPLRCTPRIDTTKGIETGTIGSYPLICPAWACFNIEDLLGITMRYQNYLAAGFNGTTARPVKIAERITSLRFFFDGVQTRLGADHPDETSGLEINRRDFITNVVLPPGTATDTRTASITLADGTVQTAPVQVVDFSWAYQSVPGIALAVLSVVVPQGRLT